MAQTLSDDSSSFFLETDQMTDCFAQHSPGAKIRLRLLSKRCQDAQEQQLPSQDYARIVSNQDGSSICFCICDGVSSSYKGGFAAHYLAISLVHWLQSLTVIPRKPSKLHRLLESELDFRAHEGQSKLASLSIPADTPALVREVLEELRATHGSQTIFLCGRIDSGIAYQRRSFQGRSAPLHRTRILLCWMGNIVAQVYPLTNLCIDLGDVDNDSNRWSTAYGRQGILAIRILTLDNLKRLIIYTDGLHALGTELSSLSDEELLLRTQQLLLSPTNDDMTLLDISWLPTSEKEH